MVKVVKKMKTLLDINGIGPKKVPFFNKLGIYHVDDLLYYYPKKYFFLKRSDMNHAVDKEKVILDGVVERKPTVMNSSSKLKVISFRIVNFSNIYSIRVYNQVYLCKILQIGMKITIIGKYDKVRNLIIASEIREGELPKKIEFEPIYGTTEGLNQKTISRAIGDLLSDKEIRVEDYIPHYLSLKYHFPDKLWSISQIHHPTDVVSYKRACQRLKYEEFFLYLLKIQYMKKCREADDKAITRSFDENKLQDFIFRLPFSLTIDQEKVLAEVKNDLVSERRMNRLLQGDVGSGKTIISFLACYINYLAGYQTALMVPTEVLACQHYENALSLFKNTDMEIVLLTSNVSKKEKDNILKRVREGQAMFVIGTQSLIQDSVIYFNLGLIITDEQHRFGVSQRQKLKNKGIYPDVLSMSATPIPRTYALTIYGDMDVSSIHTKPNGRKEVITYCKSMKEIMDVLKLMKKELDLGHQIYVIAPAIEKDNSDELDTVFRLEEKMRLAFGKICNIGIVHGKLDGLEKNKIMNQFSTGKLQILISTTVIEVGVNVPNASMIVIFQANLFGLSTLHQLRGRVGRGNIQSYCILISKDRCERLEVLENSTDGFFISEYDFKNRGEGDLFGVRQSGEAEFRLANVKKDFDLLVRVKEDVENFFSSSYLLKENQFLGNYLKGVHHLD